MTRSALAVSLHDEGLACSQAVLAPFARHLGMAPATANRIAAGLGGGIGRLGGPCGAISGGVLALSLAFGNETAGDQDAKTSNYRIVADFVRKMEGFAGAGDCRSLLGGLDLWKDEDRAAMKARGLGASVCGRIIAASVAEVERILVGAGKLQRARDDREGRGEGAAEAAAGAALDMDTDRFDIRPATEADAPLLAEFLYRLLVEVMPPGDWEAKRADMIARSADYFRRGADSPSQCNFVARTADGRPAGCICMVIEERPPHLRYDGVLFGYLHNVYVAPEFRGRGLSRAMLDRLHAEAAALGIVRVGLHASRFGRPLYAGAGYDTVERYMEKDMPT